MKYSGVELAELLGNQYIEVASKLIPAETYYYFFIEKPIALAKFQDGFTKAEIPAHAERVNAFTDKEKIHYIFREP